MSSSTWTPRAVSSEARAWSAHAWRVVEAQHAASTMKLVDDADEQALLESLLEEAKPALPAAAASLHYLLATPFRYPSARGGSRFRAAVDPGVWYGAQTVRTACAELGYWRWKFVCDALALARLAGGRPACAAVRCRRADLYAPVLFRRHAGVRARRARRRDRRDRLRVGARSAARVVRGGALAGRVLGTTPARGHPDLVAVGRPGARSLAARRGGVHLRHRGVGAADAVVRRIDAVRLEAVNECNRPRSPARPRTCGLRAWAAR